MREVSRELARICRNMPGNSGPNRAGHILRGGKIDRGLQNSWLLGDAIQVALRRPSPHAAANHYRLPFSGSIRGSVSVQMLRKAAHSDGVRAGVTG